MLAVRRFVARVIVRLAIEPLAYVCRWIDPATVTVTKTKVER